MFATKEFKKNENVARYSGEISAMRIEGPYVLQVNNHKFIDAAKTSSSAGRYANDCRTKESREGYCRGNNATLSYDYRNKRGNLKAKKPIHKGEEIYVGYSRGYWRN